ncbi:MAG: T9SS type A sorting domain-containing protein, partial [Bacteroidetes bacterium]|nr:T9SS type A sorting domain-containing protein [Bacteroidota bacterium]
GTGAIATLRFQVLVGSGMMTPLRIDPDFAFTSGRARVESRIDGTFTLIDYCAADGVRYINSAGRLQLLPNRPNPFNTSTVIEYAIAEEGVADLRVYDRMGREAAVLVSGQQTAGRHRVSLDGARLRPGVYFAVLRSGTEQVVRKLLRIE